MIRIPRSLSVKAASVLKGFLNKVRGVRINLLTIVLALRMTLREAMGELSVITISWSFLPK